MRRKPVIGGNSEKAMIFLGCASQENCLELLKRRKLPVTARRWYTQKNGCGGFFVHRSLFSFP